METDSCHGFDCCLNSQCRTERDKRYARERWLNDWSHIMWTTRQAPEWQPRRASVATCQQQSSTQTRHSFKLAHQFGQLTRDSLSIREIDRDYKRHLQQQQQQQLGKQQLFRQLDGDSNASSLARECRTSCAGVPSSREGSPIKASGVVGVAGNGGGGYENTTPREEASDESNRTSNIRGTSGHKLLENLDQGEREKHDDACGRGERIEAIVRPTKADIPQKAVDHSRPSRQLSAIKTIGDADMSTTTSSSTITARVGKRKNRLILRGENSDCVASQTLADGPETELQRDRQRQRQRQAQPTKTFEQDEQEHTSKTGRTGAVSVQQSRPNLEARLGCRGGRRRATTPSTVAATGTIFSEEGATCCPTLKTTSTLDGLAQTPATAVAAAATAAATTTSSSSAAAAAASAAAAATVVAATTTVAIAARNFKDDEETLGGAAVSEKLRLLDKQRKCLIFSMALKQIIAGRRFDLNATRGKMAAPGQECCYSGCRSRSCSFNLVNSDRAATGGDGNSAAARAGQQQQHHHHQEQQQQQQQQPHEVLHDSRTVLSSSRSALIDKLQTGRTSANSSNIQAKFNRAEERNSSELKRKPESSHICDNVPSTTTATKDTPRVRTNKNAKSPLRHQRSSIELNYQAPVGDRVAIEEVNHKMRAMRQLIVGQDELLCENQGSGRTLGWTERSNDSPSTDSCVLENEIEDEILESHSMMYCKSASAQGPASDTWANNNNNNNNNDNHFDDTTFMRRSSAARANRRSRDAMSEDSIALETDDLNLEALIVESWLDDHPSFFHEYFMRKASHQMIDDWLITHAKVSSNTNLNSHRSNNFNSSQQSLNTPARGSLRRADLDSNAGVASVSSKPRSAEIDGEHNFASIRPMRSNSQSSAGFYQEALTPVRKISATDFESRTGSSLLRPLLSTTPDGRLTFLPQQPATAYDGINQSITPKSQQQQQQHSQTNASRRSSYASEGRDAAVGVSLAATTDSAENTIAASSHDQQAAATAAPLSDMMCTQTTGELPANQADEAELTPDDGELKLIFELVKNICNDLDIRTLLHKILRNISVLINADKSSLFLVCGEPNDPNRHLVSQLFNVDQDSCEFNETEDCIRIPWGTGLVGYVAQSGESVNIANCYEDPRFTNSIDKKTGYVTKHMLCAPIFDNRNDIVGVAQVINKRDGNPFSRSDELKFKRYLQFCGIGLRNAQSYENCQLENKRNQVLLDLARMVFEEQSTIEQVVYRIMLHTQSLLECQRCQVLLIDDGSEDLDQLLKQPNCFADGGAPHRGIACNTNSNYDEHHNESDNNSSMTSSNGLDPPEWRPQCHHLAPDEASLRARSRPMDDDYLASDFVDDGYVCTEHTTNRILVDSTAGPTSKKLFSLVFDLECDGDGPIMHSTKGGDLTAINSKTSSTGPAAAGLPIKNHKFPINIGITGYVAMTGETLNIEDAHSHERFDASVDDDSDFKHKSILCMPIRNGKRQIIGVSQLINKKNGRPFNKNDENLFEAFSIFCGLGIHNTLMYERVLKIMAKQKVTFEVLSYHATAPLEEAKRLSMEQIPSCFALDLGSLKFNDFSLNEQYMLKSCLRFFLDLDLMRRFQIDQLVFCNWILSVQKNYRKVTYHPIVGGNGLKASPVRYHNWRHAFNVGQMMFAILVNTQICRALGELETLALLIACLCHDLDHRGTNNSFQIKSASPLAELYSTSTMEHHHFDQCVMILNSQGNQILANLSPAEYSKVIMLLEEAILATDLANYFKQRDTFFQLVNGNKFNWQRNAKHRSLLRCMLMTACDVAAITKPWPIQKVVADLVMSEFYQQGDIERNELNIEPIDMMNRDKMSKLPEMQISFIDTICAPIYTAFAKLFPRELGTLIDGCLANRVLWTEMANNKAQLVGSPSIGFLTNNLEFCARQTSLLPKNISRSETDLRCKRLLAQNVRLSSDCKESEDEADKVHCAADRVQIGPLSLEDFISSGVIVNSDCQRKSI